MLSSSPHLPKPLCTPAVAAKSLHHPLLHNHISSTLEIQLPLRIPNRKPIEHLQNTNINDNNTWGKKLKLIYNGDEDKTRTSTPTSSTTDVLSLMDSLRIQITPEIYTCLIKECTFEKNPIRALELLTHIRKNRKFKPTLLFLNRILLMHVSCGQHVVARQLFDEMPAKDFNSWAIMIVGYVDVLDYEQSIALFVKMMNQKNIMWFEFPSWIIVCVLKACVCKMNMGLGKQVHGLLIKLNGTNKISLMGSLINFYGKFRCLEDANFVFDQLTRHNTVVWTAKIVNSSREERFSEVFNDFREMGREGIKKNSFTLSSVLKACARMNHDHYGDGKCGRQVHANAIKVGLESNVYVQCGLVDMYGKCGLLRDAKRAFEISVDSRNVACWNAMLVSYIRNGFPVEAVKFMYRMKEAGIQVQESLIRDARNACAGGTSTSYERA